MIILFQIRVLISVSPGLFSWVSCRWSWWWGPVSRENHRRYRTSEPSLSNYSCCCCTSLDHCHGCCCCCWWCWWWGSECSLEMSPWESHFLHLLQNLRSTQNYLPGQLFPFYSSWLLNIAEVSESEMSRIYEGGRILEKVWTQITFTVLRMLITIFVF